MGPEGGIHWPPNQYLGGHLRQAKMPNGIMAWVFGSSKYVQDAVKNVETYLKKKGESLPAKARTPLSSFLNEMPIEYISTVTQESAELQGRIQKFMADGTVKIDNPAEQRIMLCGSVAFNNDLKEHFNSLGFNEGNKRTQGTFVQERAFVG